MSTVGNKRIRSPSPTSPPRASTNARSAGPPNVVDGFVEPDARRAMDLVMQLMAIPGRSGEEGAVAQFVIQQLLAAGLPAEAISTDQAHRRSPLGGQIGNLIVTLPGTVRRPRRLLAAHLDTVPVCVGSQPRRAGDFVRSKNPRSGLGGDDRAGAAVTLTAAVEILRRKLPHPPLTFLWSVQEEAGLLGARHMKVRDLGKIGLAFNWDGGAAEKLTIGATGGYRLKIDVHGLAAHAGGAPERGISATAIASLAIADLVRSGWHGLIAQGTRRGTSNVGVIRGGEATNVVTDHVELKAEARSHDARFRAQIVRRIEQAFRRAVREVHSADGAAGRVEFDGRLDYESFKLRPDEPCVLAAQRAVSEAGLAPMLAVANGGLDANWLTAHGIPTVSLGCGQMNIHTVDEMLDLAAFRQACRIALRLATDVG